MKKGNNVLSFVFAMLAIAGAIAAVCAYLKSKKAAREIREDFLADLGYEFDDGGCYCDGGHCQGDDGEGCHCGHEGACEEDSEAE